MKTEEHIPAPPWALTLQDDMNDYGSPSKPLVESFITQFALASQFTADDYAGSKTKLVAKFLRVSKWTKDHQRDVLAKYSSLIFNGKYHRYKQVVDNDWTTERATADDFFKRVDRLRTQGVLYSPDKGLHLKDDYSLTNQIGDFIESSSAKDDIQRALAEYKTDPDNAIKRLKHIVETIGNVLGYETEELNRKIKLSVDSIDLLTGDDAEKHRRSIEKIRNGIKTVLTGITEIRNDVEHQKQNFEPIKATNELMEFSIVFTVAYLRLFQEKVDS